ncbi:hypothetical protein LSAT2_025126 [Lamellibrachia satsuma]|nr:hypothetical protein LSAT2_025126 [Lamellibrachia satsuma]
MSNARLNGWAAQTSEGFTSTPKLCSLPLTTEAFEENVKRAHHQVCVRRSLKDTDPPELDPERYGWKKGVHNKSLSLTTVPKEVSLAPAAILRLWM